MTKDQFDEGVARFFAYARERHNIKLRKDDLGMKPPWTDDPILRQFRFCNVFREDDKVTRWIRHHIWHEGYGDRLLGALVIARWFNRIETLEKMLPRPDAYRSFVDNLFYSWSVTMSAWSLDMTDRLKDVSPLVTGAHMIKTPASMNKLQGLIWCLEQILPEARELQECLERPRCTLQAATAQLAAYPYLGPFMAYEVVTDLRHTPVLQDAPDIMSWANPGPGCVRGYGRVVADDPMLYNRSSAFDRDVVVRGMQAILEFSEKEEHWSQDRPSWEMRDVEHTLCEFDKYERARLGQGSPKQRYTP